jgi:hypothetical protein
MMLPLIKLLHTVVWAMLAGCIIALPVASQRHRIDVVVLLMFIILIECGILGLNYFICHDTAFAAIYTEDRRDSFDIYLPNWMARYNKTIFGTLFIINELVVVWHWKRRGNKFDDFT